MRKELLFAALLAASAPAMAAPDANNGKALFARCAACHVVAKGGGNGLGPNLFGVVGRKAASLPDFSYSPALRSSGITWSNDRLTAWITGPARLVPGTRMAFGGISNPAQVTDVVAYLDTLK